jgi:hypothetical protein
LSATHLAAISLPKAATPGSAAHEGLQQATQITALGRFSASRQAAAGSTAHQSLQQAAQITALGSSPTA